jgi:hypothetical protein
MNPFKHGRKTKENTCPSLCRSLQDKEAGEEGPKAIGP